MPTACQPAPGFPPHGNLLGVERSGAVGGHREGVGTVGLLVAGPRALGASDQLRTTLLCTEMQVAR